MVYIVSINHMSLVPWDVHKTWSGYMVEFARFLSSGGQLQKIVSDEEVQQDDQRCSETSHQLGQAQGILALDEPNRSWFDYFTRNRKIMVDD